MPRRSAPLLALSVVVALIASGAPAPRSAEATDGAFCIQSIRAFIDLEQGSADTGREDDKRRAAMLAAETTLDAVTDSWASESKAIAKVVKSLDKAFRKSERATAASDAITALVSCYRLQMEGRLTTIEGPLDQYEEIPAHASDARTIRGRAAKVRKALEATVRKTKPSQQIALLAAVAKHMDVADDTFSAFPPLVLWFEDADGDGWGNAANAVLTTVQPANFVQRAGDCDDGNGAVNPDATEIPGNSIDENCNGPNDDAV